MQTDNTMILKTPLKMSKTMQWTNDPQLLDWIHYFADSKNIVAYF